MHWFSRATIAVVVGLITMLGVYAIVKLVDFNKLLGFTLGQITIICGFYIMPQIFVIIVYSLLTRRYYEANWHLGEDNLIHWFCRTTIAVFVAIVSMAGIAFVVWYIDSLNIVKEYIPVFRNMPGIFGVFLHWWIIFIFGGWVIPLIVGICIYSILKRRYYMSKLLRRKKGLCIHCGYNLTGNISGICPECGCATKACEEEDHVMGP